jgi:hypothetical protein
MAASRLLDGSEELCSTCKVVEVCVLVRAAGAAGKASWQQAVPAHMAAKLATVFNFKEGVLREQMEVTGVVGSIESVHVSSVWGGM